MSVATSPTLTLTEAAAAWLEAKRVSDAADKALKAAREQLDALRSGDAVDLPEYGVCLVWSETAGRWSWNTKKLDGFLAALGKSREDYGSQSAPSTRLSVEPLRGGAQ